MFRELAQRAGMQEVQDIRPEQIDVYLNNAVKSTVITRIQASTQDADNRSISTLIKTGQNNDFRTLFKVAEIPFVGANNMFSLDPDEVFYGKLVSDPTKWTINDGFIYYDYHINYCTATPGWKVGGGKPVKTGTFVSPIKRVRLVEHNYLGTTLSDNILRPTARSPIVLTSSVEGSTVSIRLAFYFGELNADGKLYHDIVPYKLYLGYYRLPAEIRVSNDLNDADVDCDLPPHLHQEVVLRSVQDYKLAKADGQRPPTAAQLQQRGGDN
jgi:hypothetical protein